MTKKKVLIVDDSPVIRGFLSRVLQDAPNLEILSSASNGQVAVQYYKRHNPDIVLMDIEMPVMNGIEALKEILAFNPVAKIIMCSSLTQTNAEISMQALSLGAFDYIPKPSTNHEVANSIDFKGTLLRIIEAALMSAPIKNPPISRQENQTKKVSTTTPPSNATSPSSASVSSPTSSPKHSSTEPPARLSSVPKSLEGGFSLRSTPAEVWKPRILAIGSSTGGPQALAIVLKHLKDLSIPIVITQHMPATFTKVLAQHISAQHSMDVMEGEEGMVLQAGKIYIAPGGKHMLFKKNETGMTAIKIDDGAPENFCKPAVDPMLRSLVEIYGGKILCAILTGMGHDGLESAKSLVDAGGYVYAQDAETSIVWGMPGAVAKANICSGVYPVDDLGKRLSTLVRK